MASLLVALAGFVAVLLFIFGLKRMSSPVTATHGIVVAGWGMALAVLTLTQVTLGILNVKLSLPLPIAVAHNAGAALLLFVLVTLLARLRRPD